MWRRSSASGPPSSRRPKGKRDAVHAGATAIVSAREADDLLRDAQAFLALVERALAHHERHARRAEQGGQTS